MRHTTIISKEQFVQRKAKAMRRNPTKHELILKSELDNILPHVFRSQWWLEDFILDFYAPLLSIAIEVDGASHSSSKGIASDLLKTQVINQRGILLVRVLNSDVDRDRSEVVDRIGVAVLSRKICKKHLPVFGAGRKSIERYAVKREAETHKDCDICGGSRYVGDGIHQIVTGCTVCSGTGRVLKGEWSGLPNSADVIIRFCDRVASGALEAV